MSDDDTSCTDRWGYGYPEHDYAAGDAEGTTLAECYRCGAEAGQ